MTHTKKGKEKSKGHFHRTNTIHVKPAFSYVMLLPYGRRQTWPQRHRFQIWCFTDKTGNINKKKHQDIKMQWTYINVKYFVNAWCEHKANIQKLYCENPRSNYPNFYQQKICCSLAASGHIHKSYGCFAFLSDINPFGLCAVKSKLYLKRYRKKTTEDHFQLVSVHLPSDGIRS